MPRHFDRIKRVNKQADTRERSIDLRRGRRNFHAIETGMQREIEKKREREKVEKGRAEFDFARLIPRLPLPSHRCRTSSFQKRHGILCDLAHTRFCLYKSKRNIFYLELSISF